LEDDFTSHDEDGSETNDTGEANDNGRGANWTRNETLALFDAIGPDYEKFVKAKTTNEKVYVEFFFSFISWSNTNKSRLAIF